MRAAQAFEVILDSVKLWWKDWTNQVLVSLAAILLSLTIILSPAALFGIYQESLDLTHNERTGLIGFWKGFRTYFRQSLLWGILNLLVLLILGTNTWFYYNSTLQFAPVLIVIVLVMGVIWVVWQFFSLSCFFLQEEKSLKLAWKNGLAVFLSQPTYASVIALVMLILLFLSFRFFIPLAIGSMPLMTILGLKAVQKTIKAVETGE